MNKRMLTLVSGLTALVVSASLALLAGAAPPTKMYWTDWGTERIQRADLDGSNVKDLVTTGLSLPYGIALDVAGGKMYWTDVGTDKIQRADLDGTNVKDLVTFAQVSDLGFIALMLAGQRRSGASRLPSRWLWLRSSGWGWRSAWRRWAARPGTCGGAGSGW